MIECLVRVDKAEFGANTKFIDSNELEWFCRCTGVSEMTNTTLPAVVKVIFDLLPTVVTCHIFHTRCQNFGSIAPPTGRLRTGFCAAD